MAMAMDDDWLSWLPHETRSTLAMETTPRTNRYIPTTIGTRANQNLKQLAFLLVDDREVFYGGAAGGGKTAAILAAALQYVDEPGYNALLLRRNYKQLELPESWIPLSHQWLDHTNARWHAGQKRWTFPSGATLTFGFVGQADEDRRKYETAAFQFIGVDELTAWREEDYRFLFSRLRRKAGMPVPVRMRSASNPGGRGHEWVKRRFVDERTRVTRTIFIKALLTDNPYLDRDDYVASLQEMHPTQWRRLLHGDWDAADPGELFQPRLWLGEDDYLDESPASVVRRVRYWDLAASEPTRQNPDPDWTAGARMSRLASGMLVIEHVVRVRRSPAQTEETVKGAAIADGSRTTQYLEQVAGAGKALVDHYRRNVCPDDRRMLGNPVRGSKGMRARPLAAAMEKHRVRVVRAPWNDPLFDEMEVFSEDPQLSGAHDDQIDACAGAFEKVRLNVQARGTTTAGVRVA